MSKDLTETQWTALASFMPDGMVLGTALGCMGGIIIGTGVSLTIGLFYSSAGLLIVAVVALSALLGALFGHLMGSLLSEDVGMLEHQASAFHPGDFHEIAAHHIGEPVMGSDDLEENKQYKTVAYVEANAVLPAVKKEVPEVFTPYHSDIRIFEMILATAHRIHSESLQ